MLEAPRLTVTIPAYNEEKNLANTLEALARQTYTDFEVIVVDNNSTDKTVEIARRYGARVVKETQQGYAYAYNRGLVEAQTAVVAVTDADTQPSSNWLHSIAETFKDTRVVAATGPIEALDQKGVVKFAMEKLYELFVRLNFLIGKPHLSGFNMAMRTDALREINYLDTNFKMSPEVDLGLRIAQKGTVVFVPQMKVANSTRRWNASFLGTLTHYAQGYLYAVWLRKPPPV